MYLWLTSFFLTLVSTSGVVVMLKRICRVARPKHALVKLSDHAFPSGHTSIAFAVATCFVLFILQLPITFFDRILLVLGFFTAACAVAWWRLELRVHTVGQVFAGGLIGAGLAMVVNVVLHWVW